MFFLVGLETVLSKRLSIEAMLQLNKKFGSVFTRSIGVLGGVKKGVLSRPQTLKTPHLTPQNKKLGRPI